MVEAAKRIVLEMKDSALPIQGPPGSGKTYTAAQMIVTALAAGKRVGVTGSSHKVIRTLLDGVQSAAVLQADVPSPVFTKSPISLTMCCPTGFQRRQAMPTR